MQLTKSMFFTKILFAVFILCLTFSSFALAQDGLEGRLIDFVLQVYNDYSAELFAEVYGVMYPSVHDVLSEEEYVSFQEHHFERLKLAISEIEVGEVTCDPRLPTTLRKLISEDDEHTIYGVSLSYRAKFTSGVRFNQEVSKTVYVAVVNYGLSGEEIYLLWDPSSTQEEEQENGH